MAKLSRIKRLPLLVLLCVTCYIGLMCQMQALYSSNLPVTPADHLPLKDMDTAAAATKHIPLDVVDAHSENTYSETILHGPSLDESSVLYSKLQREDPELDRENIVQRDQPGDRRPQKRHRSARTVDFVKVGDVWVYGAFLDLRQTEAAVIRLLVLQHKEHRGRLLCSVLAEGKPLTLFTQAYKMCENHGKTYEGWIYSCVLPATLRALPHNVSVIPLSHKGHRDMGATFSLPTIPAQPDPGKGDSIGVCVPPLFGDLSLATIVQFLQLCKVLGADRVFLYLASVSSEIAKFLTHHSRRDPSLSVINWNLPGNISQSSEHVWYHGQLLAIQDCLYNNMASFSFLLFQDLDEMLVPRASFDWPQTLRKIFTSCSVNRNSVAALSFKSTFYDPTRVPEDFESIRYFQYLHRTAVSKVRNKLLVQPLKVFELGIHHLSKGLSDDFRTVNVSESIAMIHHYRQCEHTYDPDMKCFQTREDRTMLRYKDKLTLLSHRVITDASKLFA